MHCIYCTHTLQLSPATVYTQLWTYLQGILGYYEQIYNKTVLLPSEFTVHLYL